MGIQILHNSRCSKSREALQYLENQNIDFELINIIQNPLNKQEVVSVLQKLGMKAEDLVRKSDALFKEKYAGHELDEDAWINVLVDNPTLIQRPVVIKDNKAVIGRPLENIVDFLK
ncbi:arsenate reductase (glutaredoxin) [Elizabethkingia anophelis]|uniref:arsenate reductase (glutaredoxin) n=1 Tax=Elizabethkingia anophelis TaxID=1117645 RepID=UPI000C9CBA97|nr:arsenate reductase (glutaredoxin) [Elizabethkingia anophelis]MCT3759219.1 arsenate reductase (glutaredoxin) [Elizabethkingia anophelis]MCT3972084.1 arsenate reductase (glutaredoxin) [Elizabethkingia anophelis]MCT4000561.1 arsenate reductase (glutaredoxin) [Elizabethkingia anophelis]MCT4014458.1 arsenate reductase (glutaredoxin) [Elizabethkingia anophelis]MCT4018019.1 arsenate reductase (glutaredoxin) [Elizabethkingia anophelis]